MTSSDPARCSPGPTQFLDDFLALVSQELRAPLTTIHGGAQVLSSRPDLDPAVREELLHDVLAESERLDRRLSNLQTLATIAAGRLHASIEPVRMASLVTRVTGTFNKRSLNYCFVVDVVPELPPAAADSALLEDALTNLYESVIESSPHGGSIRTTVVAEASTIVTHVIGEGIEITPERLTAIFERSGRTGDQRTLPGMGIGLSLCRALVEMQGGSIAASSPGIGCGSTFSVTLPIAQG